MERRRSLLTQDMADMTKSAQRKRYAHGRTCPRCQRLLCSWNKGPLCYSCEMKTTEERPVEQLALRRF